MKNLKCIILVATLLRMMYSAQMVALFAIMRFRIAMGFKVPLIWNHEHREPWGCLGMLIWRTGMMAFYAYGVFNDTEQGKNALEYVRHGI